MGGLGPGPSPKFGTGGKSEARPLGIIPLVKFLIGIFAAP